MVSDNFKVIRASHCKLLHRAMLALMDDPELTVPRVKREMRVREDTRDRPGLQDHQVCMKLFCTTNLKSLPSGQGGETSEARGMGVHYILGGGAGPRGEQGSPGPRGQSVSSSSEIELPIELYIV